MLQLPNCKQHTTYGAYSKCKKEYLDGFKKKDFFFDAPLEGLFHDCCSLIGISEKELNIASLNAKLDKLKEKENNDLRSNYEYFSFRFPVIRNKVAHGRYFESDNQLQTLFLIFDLFTLCERITNPKIELNKYIALLRGKIEFENILEIVRFKEMVLPTFYQKEIERVKQIKEQIKENVFKVFLKEQILKEDELGLKILQKDIGYIKKCFVDKDDKELLGVFGGICGLINGRLQK